MTGSGCVDPPEPTPIDYADKYCSASNFSTPGQAPFTSNRRGGWAQTSDQGIAVRTHRFWRQVGVRVVRES
jgi:hypothetical protein